MGMGMNWFHGVGQFSVDQLAYQYGDLALRLVGGFVMPPRGEKVSSRDQDQSAA